MPTRDTPAHATVWVHDLRNAINAASVSTHVVRRLLEDGQVGPALRFLEDVEAACERCRKLSAHPPLGDEHGPAD